MSERGHSVRSSQRVKQGQMPEAGKQGYIINIVNNYIYLLKYDFDCYERIDCWEYRRRL